MFKKNYLNRFCGAALSCSNTSHSYSENQFDFVLLLSEVIWCRIITTTKGREHILNEMYYLAFLYKKKTNMLTLILFSR